MGYKPFSIVFLSINIYNKLIGFIIELWETTAYIMKRYLCLICGLIYDEADGWPDDGIEPGTKWENVPENWACPDCGAGKEDFDMIEIT